MLVVRSPLLPRGDDDREKGLWEGDKPGEELPDLQIKKKKEQGTQLDFFFSFSLSMFHATVRTHLY